MTLQNLKYSVLDLAYIAQGNTIKQTLNNSLDLARYVEDWDIPVSGWQNIIIW